MSIDKDKEEKMIENQCDVKDKRNRKRMAVTGKGVFELQKLLAGSRGERINKLKNSRNRKKS